MSGCPDCEANQRVKEETQKVCYELDKARVEAESRLRAEHEVGYTDGVRSAGIVQLHQALKTVLGVSAGVDAAVMFAKLALERQETIATLRRLLHDLGDDDWPDELHLSDIIEKHLLLALARTEPPNGGASGLGSTPR